MEFINYNCLENLLITTETTDFSGLSEDKYNKYFLKIKTESFKVLKSIVDDIRNNDPINKLKVVAGSGYKTGEKTYTRTSGYNEIPVGVFQYTRVNALSDIEVEFNKIMTDKYPDIINDKIMYFKFDGYSVFMYYKQYTPVMATEGFFSKMKEKREAKKLENETKKLENETKQKEWNEFVNYCEKVYNNSLKPEITKILNKVKNKYQKDNLPWRIVFGFDKKEPSFWINIFEDEWCMNEYHEKYIPAAIDAFDQCYDVVKDFCNKNSNTGKYSTMDFDADVIENNDITISINKVEAKSV